MGLPETETEQSSIDEKHVADVDLRENKV